MEIKEKIKKLEQEKKYLNILKQNYYEASNFVKRFALSNLFTFIGTFIVMCLYILISMHFNIDLNPTTISILAFSWMSSPVILQILIIKRDPELPQKLQETTKELEELYIRYSRQLNKVLELEKEIKNST